MPTTELIHSLTALWLVFACMFYMVDGWRIRRRDRRIIHKLRVIRCYTYESDTEEMAVEIASMMGVDINA